MAAPLTRYRMNHHLESNEQDPNGLSPSDPGAKLDDGKLIVDQVLGMFSHALEEVAKVGNYGAGKYSVGGWQHVPDGQTRYANAGMRHWLKRKQGEDVDQESGLLHLAQEAWNALAVLELYMREKK